MSAPAKTMWCRSLPIEVVSEANQRGHWAEKARRVKKHRETARFVVAARREKALPSEVRMVRLMRKGQRPFDDDNLRSAFKAVRDGIADALGVKDNDPRVTWHYAQQRGSGLATVSVELIWETQGETA